MQAFVENGEKGDPGEADASAMRTYEMFLEEKRDPLCMGAGGIALNPHDRLFHNPIMERYRERLHRGAVLVGDQQALDLLARVEELGREI